MWVKTLVAMTMKMMGQKEQEKLERHIDLDKPERTLKRECVERMRGQETQGKTQCWHQMTIGTLGRRCCVVKFMLFLPSGNKGN